MSYGLRVNLADGTVLLDSTKMGLSYILGGVSGSSGVTINYAPVSGSPNSLSQVEFPEMGFNGTFNPGGEDTARFQDRCLTLALTNLTTEFGVRQSISTSHSDAGLENYAQINNKIVYTNDHITSFKADGATSSKAGYYFITGLENNV